MTRLLLISTEFPPGPGGIGTHAYQLARGLSERAWNVTVVARQDYVTESERNNFNKQLPFQVISIPSIKSTLYGTWRRLRLVKETIRSNNIDLVICSGSRSVWLASRLPQKTVAIGHGTEFGLSGIPGLLTRWSFSKVDKVICVSQYTADYMTARNIYPKSIAVIHNGADPHSYRALSQLEITEQRRKMGFSSTDLLILTVGSVTPRKGQEIIIRALPLILSQQPNVHYVVAGLPTFQDNLIALAREIGVSDHVHFLGIINPEKLNAIYNACDLFAMTSRNTDDGDFEGYGIAVIEAALCGKAAIVSDNSGLQEAVVNDVTGLVVPQNNYNATAQAILSLLNDPFKREVLSRNALENAAKHATWLHRIREYDALLRELITQ